MMLPEWVAGGKFLSMKNVAKFSVTNLKPIFAEENKQKFATRKPRHFSLPQFQIFITLNFWDRSLGIDYASSSPERNSD